MQTRLVFGLLTLLQCNLFYIVSGACETEDDLDFEACDLKDLKEDALTVSFATGVWKVWWERGVYIGEHQGLFVTLPSHDALKSIWYCISPPSS